MQGLLSRYLLVTLIGLTVMVGSVALASTSGEARADVEQPDRGQQIAAGVTDAVGLVQDRRGCFYVASQTTGKIFCVPPTGEALVLARVPGEPRCLAVNRNRTVFVGTQSGVVYGVQPDGSVVEVGQVDGPAIGLVVDRDGALLVATTGGMVVRVAYEN
jgi:sugar lactone lactonase YvrE